MSREAMKQALEALESANGMLERADCSTGYCCCGSSVEGHTISDGHSPVDEGEYFQSKAIKASQEAITALRQALANEALDRMAENARELGLDYETADEHKQALREATQIATWLWQNFYKNTAPQWEVLPDICGVLSQIDNMVAGLKYSDCKPVAWMFEFPDKRVAPKFDSAPHGGNWMALYTRPQPAAQEFYHHVVENEGDWSEWVNPDNDSYMMKCCDCGLVHEMQFKVAKYSEGDECEFVDDPDLQPVFRARRAEEAWQEKDTAHRSGGLPQPAAWVGLTDEERRDALVSVDAETKRLPPGFRDFARAIEQALKEKNGL